MDEAFATAAVIESAASSPEPPQTIEELGLPIFLLTDLVLRYAREHGTVSVAGLRRALKLSYSVADTLFQDLRKKQLIDIKSAGVGDYVFALTSAARELAAERADVCRYAGPAPVPLDQYAQVIRSQRASIRLTSAQLREAFADLVVSDKVVNQIGPAVMSGRPIFVYGPTGNGKTSIIERLPKLYDDSVLIPYAVEVDAHIITVFDPLVHRPIEGDPDEGVDPRWVRCSRPCVMAGGELVGSMLDLRLDDRSGVYAAPLQMKAANGILLIDDFGRQKMPPHELFNRWILPLDRRIDYLSLQYGFTFQIPFEVLLAFATNLDPSDVADEAFLRRVPNKIYMGCLTPEAFDEIFRRILGRYGLPFEPALAAALRSLCHQHQPAGLRACYPRDVCEILVALAEYNGQPFRLTREGLRAATDIYFARGKEESSAD